MLDFRYTLPVFKTTMSKKIRYRVSCIAVLMCIAFNSFCQGYVNLDSLESFEQREAIKLEVKKALKQSLIPGLSQIKNKQIWKIPFFYGGFVALSSFTLGHHALYKKTYGEYYNNKADYNLYLRNEPYLARYGQEYDELERLSLSANRHKNLSYVYLACTALLYNLNLCDGIHPVYSKYRSPYKAGLYSALVPGLGQIYNRHYWKLPILYAGLAVSAYYVNFTHVEYKKNLTAYYVLTVDNAREAASEYYAKNKYYRNEASFWEKQNLSRGKYFLLETFSRLDFQTANQLLVEKDRWKRYRDLNILGLVAIYAVNIVDASVYAHLFDYDISEDLSLRFRPNFINISKEPVNIGFSLAMNF